MKRIAQLTLVILVLLLFAGVVGAAPPLQEDEEQIYVVQPNEGLIELARRFYNDGDAYIVIVEATNARAETDSTFLVIADPNIILVGQKLVIPGLAELPIDDVPEMPAVDAEDEMGTEEEMTTPDVPSDLETIPLAGTSWILNTMEGKSPLQGTTISLDFIDEMSAGGTSGCNSYSTTYELDGIRISFGTTAGTLMACTEPVMEQEAAFLQVLADAAFYEIPQSGSLWLFNGDTTLLATFEPASSKLGGTSWDVISYNNGNEAVVSVLSDTALTAVFSAEGQLSGSAGCNNYTGPFVTDGDAISIGPLASTRKFCADEGVMEQENAFLTALETAATFKITGDSMEMRTEDGALVANFSRSE